MSYAEDNFHDLDPEFLGLCPHGNDFDIDSKRLSEDIEYIQIPAWRMKDSKLIAIRDMDTSHIKNCIKMIHKSNGTWRHQYLRYFELELLRREFLPNPPEVIYIDL